jgi:hypothetical protein
MALSNAQVEQSNALSQYFVWTTLAFIQTHSFSEKLNPVSVPRFFPAVAMVALLDPFRAKCFSCISAGSLFRGR